MSAEGIFLELSVIIIIAVLISGIMRLLKQPLIIGYIITGLLVSPHFLNLVSADESAIATFASVGVSFLLFLVGLHLNPNNMRDVGKISIVTGLGQVLFTSIGGFLISYMLGFGLVESVYIAIALTFSSTIIIMKLLSDKRDMDSLYGKIAIGFLIVQDIVAMILLMVVSSTVSDASIPVIIVDTLAKATLLALGLYLITKLVMPRLTAKVAESQEFLLFFSAGWCMILASIFLLLGFTVEIGALVAGVVLSFSPYRHQISSKMKVLRDFFLLLFFVVLGSQMVFSNVTEMIIPVLIFSFFVLIGNPLIVMLIMGLLGYRKRTSFMAGLTVAQISEFSLILVALGVRVGHLSSEILSFVTFIGIITIAGSTYFIMYSNKIYDKLSPYLDIFEKKELKEKDGLKKKEFDVVLFGHNRIGSDLYQSLIKEKKSVLVVDYNPSTVDKLEKKKIDCLYGDASDNEFLNELELSKYKMVISTIPDKQTNQLLITKVKQENPVILLIVVSHYIDDALELYADGADYVVMPHFLGSEHTAQTLKENNFKTEKYDDLKKKQIKSLTDKKKKGYEHPSYEEEKK